MMTNNKTLWLITISLLCSLNYVPVALADDANILRNKYQNLIPQLESNQFQRQLHLDSTESPSTIKGDIYAVVDYPFATVNGSLNNPVHGPDNWCDVLMLHLNTKYCNVSTSDNRPILKMGIGKKINSLMANVYDLQFNYQAATSAKDYFQVDLNADTGPLSTKDYRIVLEAVPIDKNHTFLHMTYSYGYGMAGRLAMKTYLATIGRGKVGFTTISTDSNAKNKYIGGIRGVVERNTMRYYLAIDAYLKALTSAPGKALELRLIYWFDATEQYPTQLHEIEREEYMQMKQELILDDIKHKTDSAHVTSRM